MRLSAILLRALVIAALSAAFAGAASALGLSLVMDRTQTALGAAIVAGCILVYGKLVTMSSKRG